MMETVVVTVTMPMVSTVTMMMMSIASAYTQNTYGGFTYR